MEHFKDVRDDNDMPIWECSGWTCDGGVDFWRERALKAEARVKELEEKAQMLETNIRRLWDTTNA
jgi:hypothetical protein